MDKIKFRAFDKQLNEMFKVEKIEFDKELVYVRSEERNHITTSRLISDEVCTVMQFISLKDENGKEIYEGDIVKSTNKELGECVAVVGFNEEESAFVLLEGYGWKRPDEFFSTWNKVYKFEVIGNIYENKELLV